ncbi:hypothetical protein [Tabrizicola sp. M-4]|uniref:hypothetical protein n=1 Tax=Tabrizicola sp. M-4 TaxID=3055847 RepID=UPI003DA7A77C
MTGRPAIVLTDPQRAEVETLAAVLTAAQIADFLGIGRTTFFNLIDRDPDLCERYKRGKARAVGAVAQSLVTKARAGNVTAMIFYLKTQGGWRETVEIDSRTTLVDAQGKGEAFSRLTAYLDQIAERMAMPGNIIDHAPHEEADHA